MAKRNIVHFELAARSRPELAQFYADVFGWEYEHIGEPAPYTLVKAGNIGGGLSDIGEEYKQGDVVIYLDSDDVAADLERIERAGGRTLAGPFPVGDFGEMAFFQDPSGNRLALWKNLMPAEGSDAT